jgi:hypothetical protein
MAAAISLGKLRCHLSSPVSRDHVLVVHDPVFLAVDALDQPPAILGERDTIAGARRHEAVMRGMLRTMRLTPTATSMPLSTACSSRSTCSAAR